jgi:hypothetical protein
LIATKLWKNDGKNEVLPNRGSTPYYRFQQQRDIDQSVLKRQSFLPANFIFTPLFFFT